MDCWAAIFLFFAGNGLFKSRVLRCCLGVLWAFDSPQKREHEVAIVGGFAGIIAAVVMVCLVAAGAAGGAVLWIIDSINGVRVEVAELRVEVGEVRGEVAVLSTRMDVLETRIYSLEGKARGINEYLRNRDNQSPSSKTLPRWAWKSLPHKKRRSAPRHKHGLETPGFSVGRFCLRSVGLLGDNAFIFYAEAKVVIDKPGVPP